MELFTNGKLPQLFVFDLDFTLWPFDCGKDVWAPYTVNMFGITDWFGRPANPCADVRSIIGALIDNDVPFAIASRNPAIGEIEALLKAIKVDCKKGSISIWDALPSPNYVQAYSSGGFNGKRKHFAALNKLTGVEYNQMLFFDDLPENIKYAFAQDIISVQLGKAGLTWERVSAGLNAWRAVFAVSNDKI